MPYLLNNWALARVQSSIVAVYVLLQPVIAATLGRVLLHELFGRHTAIAAALVVAGVVLIRTIQELLGHSDVATTIIYTDVLNRGGRGVKSPLDSIG